MKILSAVLYLFAVTSFALNEENPFVRGDPKYPKGNILGLGLGTSLPLVLEPLLLGLALLLGLGLGILGSLLVLSPSRLLRRSPDAL